MYDTGTSAITWSEVEATPRQLLEGLVAIQQQGFAHRDLKPEVRPPHPPRHKHQVDMGYIKVLWSPHLPYESKLGTLD